MSRNIGDRMADSRPVRARNSRGANEIQKINEERLRKLLGRSSKRS